MGPLIPSFGLSLLLGASLLANSPPATPVISEPAVDGKIVNPGDVHMETLPFSDPDAGDTHLCTDWEIWTVTPSARVWFTSCIGGVERLHTHLGDGAFQGSYAGRTELFPDTDYRLRARHRDSSGDPATEWSAYGQRLFRTGPPTQVFPLQLDEIAASPPPDWTDPAGDPVVLPAGGTQPSLRLESAAADLLLEIRGLDGASNAVTNPATLPDHVPVRATFFAGSLGTDLVLPESQIEVTDHEGTLHTIYFPTIALSPGTRRYLWVAANGSTYNGTSSQTTPDFSSLAAGAPVPWVATQAGYKVEVVGTGFQLPVNIAFVPSPGGAATSPIYYVTELYGKIKVVLRDGTVGDYATGLLNYNPTGNFPGSGEQGLSGIVVDPTSGDVFAGMLYSTNPANDGAAHYPKVVRFHSTDGGHTAATQTIIRDMTGESQGQSHQISNFSIGPDGKLYVHMGDGFDATKGRDMSSYRGKVLRMNLDGSAPSDNPFYNAGNGISATDYIYALGLRNPFGGAWRLADGFHYEVENGPSVDRFAKIVKGEDYLYTGSDADMRQKAIYNWDPAHAPVNIAFVENGRFGGSGFPSDKLGHAFVSESGPTWGTGAQAQGKRIVEFVLNGSGGLVSGPTTLAEYTGTGKGSAVGLTAGPDGLYFTDLYKDQGYSSPIDRGANILRIRFVGTADFVSDVNFGPPPLAVQFTDASNIASPSSWYWDFGDGATSTEQNPTHTYSANGSYDVLLRVQGSAGVGVLKKPGFISVGSGGGLKGEYFDNMDLTAPKVTRLDPTVDFDWGNGSPDPAVGADTFSVRWTGRVEPLFTETYTFYTMSDDGVRLWVNGTQVINNWTDHAPTENSGTIALTAGLKYDVQMEMYENGGGAVARLSWSSSHQTKQIIPVGRLSPPQSTVPDIINLTCSDAGTNANLAWTNRGVYEAIHVYQNGALARTLGGVAVSVSLPLDTGITVNMFRVASVVAGDERAGQTCSVLVTPSGYTRVINEDFSPPASATVLSVNCSAVQVSSVLQLTAPATDQAGSAFFRTPQSDADFIADFDMSLNEASNPGADGIAFIINTGTDVTSCGGTGGGMGYFTNDTGPPAFPGFAVVFDTWQNAGEVSHNWIGFIDASKGRAPQVAVDLPEELTNNGTFHATVIGQDGVFALFLSNPAVELSERSIFTFTVPGFVARSAFFGFSAGTGGAFARHIIDNFVLQVPAEPPVAAFIGSPLSGAAPLDVTFTNQTTGPASSYAWDFGDGGLSAVKSPVHTYAAAGTYTVKLTSTGAGGSDVATRLNYVHVTAPEPVAAAFTGLPRTGKLPLRVQFTSQSTGPVTMYAWDFGDGGTSTAAGPSHIYNSAGKYTVKLRVTGSSGQEDTRTEVDYILVDSALDADFVGNPLNGTAPLTVKFADLSTGTGIQSRTWDFGDGSATSNAANPTHVYAAPGTFTVKLTIKGFAATDTETKTAYIHVQGPGGTIRRADANDDGGVDLADAIFILNFLFQGGVEPRCFDAADADDSGEIDISDGIRILGYLFSGLAPPAPPFPGPGPDPTPDGLPDCAP